MWPASRYSTVTSRTGENDWRYEMRGEELERALGIGLAVERLGRRLTLPCPPLVHELEVALLDRRAVEQHERAEVVGGVRRPDPAAEAVAIETRQEPAVIDVGMREEDGVDRARVEGQRLVLHLGFGAPALEQAAVEQQPSSVLRARPDASIR